MEISHLDHLSPETLLGIVNEKLRLCCDDRQALFYELDIGADELENKLGEIGYHYHAASNQYRRLK